MKRRLFTILSAMSLLLGVAMCVLWVRSYYYTDEITYWSSTQLVAIGDELFSRQGLIACQHEVREANKPLPPPIYTGWRIDSEKTNDSHAYLLTSPQLDRRYGFAYSRRDFGPLARDPEQFRLNGFRLVFPYWFPAILFAILPAFWFFFAPHRRRAKRLRLGHCPICNYDLRASPDRCPECGKVSARSSTS